MTSQAYQGMQNAVLSFIFYPFIPKAKENRASELKTMLCAPYCTETLWGTCSTFLLNKNHCNQIMAKKPQTDKHKMHKLFM